MIKRVERGLPSCKGPFGYKNYRPHEDAESIYVFDNGPDRYMREAFELVATRVHTPTEVKRILDSRYPSLAESVEL